MLQNCIFPFITHDSVRATVDFGLIPGILGVIGVHGWKAQNILIFTTF